MTAESSTIHQIERWRPWHAWVVAAVVFAMYVGGARDYVLIVIEDNNYVRSQFGPGGVAYFADYPWFLRVLWTVNILGGLFAPIYLLMRSRWALPVAITSLASQLFLGGITFTLCNRWNALGSAIAVFDLVITAVTAAFAYYCWRLRPPRQLSAGNG